MIRRSTWEADLAAYIASVRDRPFEWGAHDCALFAAGAVIAITGDDPIPEYRGKYTTEIGSAKALKRFGAGTLDATLDRLFPPVPRAMAQRGDLVWHDDSVGVVMGGHALFVGREGEHEGLVKVERALWEKGWRVG